MKNKTLFSLTLGAFLCATSHAALIGYWSFDGDTDADAGGWGASTIEGTGATVSFVNDAPPEIPGTQSLAFADANTQLVKTGFDAQAAGITGANPTFTVAYWFKITDVTISQRDMVAIADGDSTSGGQVAWFDFDASNDIKVFYQNGRTSSNSGDGGTGGVIDWDTVPDTDWHHLALTYNLTHGGSFLYLDGVQVGGQVNPVNTLNFPTDVFLTIGGTYNGTSSALSRLIPNIQIADLAVWDEALDSGTIEDLADGSLQVLPPETSGNLKITSFASAGANLWELVLQGEPSTGYVFYSSTTLDFTPGTLVENLSQGDPGDEGTVGGPNDSVLTTDANGDGRVRVTLTGDPADFVRAQTAP